MLRSSHDNTYRKIFLFEEVQDESRRKRELFILQVLASELEQAPIGQPLAHEHGGNFELDPCILAIPERSYHTGRIEN